MPVFDYLGVLISIVLGFALTQLLTGFGQLIKYKRTIKPYWPHVAWIVLVFFTIVQVWWGLWNWRAIPRFYYFSFLYLVVVPMVVLYLLAVLAFPDLQAGETVDLRSYYLERRIGFFGLVAAFHLFTLTGAVVLRGVNVLSTENLFRAGLSAIAIACMISKSPRVHVAAALLYALVFFGFQALFRSCIGNCL